VSPSKRAAVEAPRAVAKPAVAVASRKKPAKGNIVSMKEWVARYAPRAPLGPEPSAKRNGKRGERK
ncbi:MAG TPA: hypothetical protein VFF96_09440, partial [Pseudoxanthomonas sp.]|nr:hypothetical protein [Pseudoxanthomonas sp.]